MPIQGVLFDVDDTLFDYSASEEAGVLAQLQAEGLFERFPDSATAVALWRNIMERQYARFLNGELTFPEQRRERAREFLSTFGQTTPGPRNRSGPGAPTGAPSRPFRCRACPRRPSSRSTRSRSRAAPRRPCAPRDAAAQRDKGRDVAVTRSSQSSATRSLPLPRCEPDAPTGPEALSSGRQVSFKKFVQTSTISLHNWRKAAGRQRGFGDRCRRFGDWCHRTPTFLKRSSPCRGCVIPKRS